MSTVSAGDKVRINYTGKFENGEVFDSSQGRDPLAFTAGGPELIPGVSNAVIGMAVGQSKTVTIAPEQGYGPHNPELTQRVDLERMPPDVAVGMQLQAQIQDQMVSFWVTEVGGDFAVVDANHPLAGKVLVFEIELVAIGG